MAKTANYLAEDGELTGVRKQSERPAHQKITTALMLPREHGAWAMLLMPYLLGTIAGRHLGLPSLLLLAAVLLLFTASRPLDLLMQGGRGGAAVHLAVYGLVGSAAGIALLLAYGLWLLVPLGLLAGTALASQLVLRRHRMDRTWPARLVSIAALSATGPAAYYVATGFLDARASAVWAMALLYSGASVFYVRLFYRPPTRNSGGSSADSREQAERQMAVYVLAATSAVGLLALLGFAPPLGVIVFVPLALKAAAGCRRRDSRPTLRQIGFAEMGHTALFLSLSSAAMWLW